jgi:4-hydroxybenzoate polyprenyltransferase
MMPVIANPAPIATLLRPTHWVKNAFVLVPLFLSFQFTNLSMVIRSLLGVLVFSLAASAVYVGNDIVDREQDRLHEKKRNRPIASGAVPIPTAIVLLMVLLVTSLTTAFALSLQTGAIAIAYLAMNTLYSFRLKRVPIIDVFIFATGFVLRILLGGEVIGVEISRWMVLITIFLSLFLGFNKRLTEIRGFGTAHRPVLASYTSEALVVFVVVSGVMTLVTYTFYTIDQEVATRFYAPRLMYTIPVVVFGLFRYILAVFGGSDGGDVAELVTHDVSIMLSVVLWVGIVAWAHIW